MARRSRESKGKTINPTLFVFCEGQSEKNYINFLRNKYRLPVEIVSHILKNKISERIVKEKLKYSIRHEKDKIYLMYDIDVPGIFEKLLDINNRVGSILLLSNPCFELWYILFYCNQNSELSTDNCIKKLENLCSDYAKGDISKKLKEKLETKLHDAIKRSKNLELHKNPSTNIFTLIEDLDEIKQGKI